MTASSRSAHETGPKSKIVRHPVSEEGVRKRVRLLGEDLPDAVAAARRNLVHCNSLKLDALAHAAQLLVLSPGSRDICRSLRLGAEAVVAIFEGAMATGDQIEVQLGEGAPARIPSAVSPGSHHGGNWKDGFFMAAICREKSLVDSLSRVPSQVFRGSSTRGLEHAYRFAEALQSYWKREGGSAEQALSALRAAEDENLPAPTVIATRELAVPEIRAFLRLIEKEAGPFNETLAQALVLHRQYWSRSEDLARDPRGYFSLSLTGLAALAYDAGIPITVESDYLPMGLVRGDCRPPAETG
jgi:hypothetical protein